MENSWGRRFFELMDDIGLIVFNGRVNGNVDGDFTFLGSMGGKYREKV